MNQSSNYDLSFTHMISFIHSNDPLILWCYTGGGHHFEENFRALISILDYSIKVLMVFSNSGALVANRYGFFYEIQKYTHFKEKIFFIFENQEIVNYNIEKILVKGGFHYLINRYDPSFSVAQSLSQYSFHHIIVSPLTSNTAAKICTGVNDTLITNLIINSVKMGKEIVLVPTDMEEGSVKTKLPIRFTGGLGDQEFGNFLCKYEAIKYIRETITFLPEFCVGCKVCVHKLPNIFTYGDVISINVRKVDASNISKLAKEFTIISIPSDIPKLIKK
ncbi:flavoprotein [Candidatus Hodarchaeum mangrovi]